jgi:23S rRNA-/tRNA-specific pseudouridylate synthase
MADSESSDLKQRLRLPDLPLPLHRLDKVSSIFLIPLPPILIGPCQRIQSTTGTLVLARTPPVARALSQQFQIRDVHKTYLALVRGGELSFPGTSGEIRAPLKFTDGRVSLAGAKAGKMAATDWQLLGSSVRVAHSLETGLC